jgi:hypothetical protein
MTVSAVPPGFTGPRSAPAAAFDRSSMPVRLACVGSTQASGSKGSCTSSTLTDFAQERYGAVPSQSCQPYGWEEYCAGQALSPPGSLRLTRLSHSERRGDASRGRLTGRTHSTPAWPHSVPARAWSRAVQISGGMKLAGRQSKTPVWCGASRPSAAPWDVRGVVTRDTATRAKTLSEEGARLCN